MSDVYTLESEKEFREAYRKIDGWTDYLEELNDVQKIVSIAGIAEKIEVSADTSYDSKTIDQFLEGTIENSDASFSNEARTIEEAAEEVSERKNFA